MNNNEVHILCGSIAITHGSGFGRYLRPEYNQQSTVYLSDWLTADFDDFSWPAAIEYGANGVSAIFDYTPNIHLDARRIMVVNLGFIGTVYCRKNIGKYK